MATLLEKVQHSLATAGSEPVGTTDQTNRARTLLAAKSGKAVAPGALAPASNVAETSAVDRTREAAAELQPAGQVAAAQMGQAEANLASRESGARADLALRQQQMQQQNSLRKNQLLADLSRDRATLNLERDKSKIEQLAHTMRLSDKKYVDMLEREGQKQRLDNDLAFKESLSKAILGSNHDLMVSSLKQGNMLNASDREFANAMAQIDLNAAISMANNEAADAKQAAMISGAGGLASAGISGYGAYSDAHPTTKSTSTTGATAPANSGTTQTHGGEGWKSGV